MRKALAVLSLPLALAAQAAELDRLRPGDVVKGFRATALYLDESDRPIAARFVHLRTRHTLDLLRIESVPQAYTWINTIPVSDQGEPHTQEHLLLLKGTAGRRLSTRQTMSLSGSSAFTQQWRTSYFFHTAAGEDVFFELFEEKIRAMLHPTYDDEEIRREVRFFGVTQNADGTLRLEEQGTVYQEMLSHAFNQYSRLYRAMGHLVYGERHPLAYNAGGEPAAIRTMTPGDIRRFQKATHHLANMGTIAAFAPSTPVASVLERFDRVLSQADPKAKPRPADTLDKLPTPEAAPRGAIRIYEYPHRNEQQPSPMALVWPAVRRLDATEQLLAEVFIASVAGDATTNLYKLFIDGRTRKMDLGARSLAGYVYREGGHPAYVLFNDVAPANFTEEKLSAVRALVMAEIRRIASLPDGSPELAEFNARVRNRIVEARRDLVKFTGTPPGFGFRGGNSQWMDHLLLLDRVPGARKSLTLKPQVAFASRLLDSKRNFWRDYLARWELTAEPYVAVARPSPAMLQREEAERQARIAAETARLEKEYGVDDTQEALRRFQARSKAEAERIEEEARKVAAIPFVKSPPMTLDDHLRYEVVKLANGVPLVASRFDSMTSATTGLALRLDGIPREQLRYVSLLPALLSTVGVIEDGKPVPYEEMRERLRREILGLEAVFSTNVRTGRVELLLRGSGIGVEESRRALEWMRLILHAPDWRPENLPRIRDVVDQSLARLRNTMQGLEEAWVQNPAQAWQQQRNAAFLAADSFLTRTHNALRLRWLLKAAPAGDEQALAAFFTGLAAAGQGKGRAELKAMLTAERAPGLEALLPAARALATDALRDLDLALIEIPDAALAADFAYLATALRDDLAVPPAEALAKLDGVRKRILRSGGARMFLASSGALRSGLVPAVEKLAAGFAEGAHEPIAPIAPLVESRLRERDPQASPTHVSLYSPNKQGGVIITSVPAAHYNDLADREKQLDFLASRLHSGGGSHGIFLKTLAAGLAYSNGLRGSVSSGRVGYYAERTPELPQTVRFVVSELKAAKPLPHLGEYAIAQAFLESRAAQTYEARAEGIAADLADRQAPEAVRRFRESMLELRKQPDLVETLFARKDRVYGSLLPGYGGQLARDGYYFAIGPDRQLDLWAQYLEATEGAGSKLHRLYGRDYWMP